MSRLFPLAFLLALFCVSGCTSAPVAKPLSIGSQVDFAHLQDQHGNPFTHHDATTTVLYVDTMKGNALVRDTLSRVDNSCMTEGRVVYLADISGMPSIISTLIAVPRMRDYPYPVWLDRNGLATEALPLEEDAVTVLTLEDSAIVAVEYLTLESALEQRLLAECGPARPDAESAQ